MSTVKNSFIIRSNNTDTKVFFDAIKYIDQLLITNPDVKIIPDSPLYQLAVSQYNGVIKNTLIRPNVPSWFCGVINPITGELDEALTDQELRVLGGVSGEVLPPAPAVPNPDGQWPDDKCLPRGTPGSIGYSKCDVGNEVVDSTSDYNSSVESYPHEPVYVKKDKIHDFDAKWWGF